MQSFLALHDRNKTDLERKMAGVYGTLRKSTVEFTLLLCISEGLGAQADLTAKKDKEKGKEWEKIEGRGEGPG